MILNLINYWANLVNRLIRLISVSLFWLYITTHDSFISERGRIAMYYFFKFIYSMRYQLTFFTNLFIHVLFFSGLKLLQRLTILSYWFLSYWFFLCSSVFSSYRDSVSFYISNKADLVWLFFLKKKTNCLYIIFHRFMTYRSFLYRD